MNYLVLRGMAYTDETISDVIRVAENVIGYSKLRPLQEASCLEKLRKG